MYRMALWARFSLFPLIASVSQAHAQQAHRGTASRWTGWSVYWENDSFVLPHLSSDRAYTNGVRFTLSGNPNRPRKWVTRFTDEVTNLVGPAAPVVATFGLVFGQNFFTPEVITTFEPDPLDRPFAGHLYAGGRVDITQEAPENPRAFHRRAQHSFEVDVGFLGPPALADQVQTGVHLLRQSRIPKGWERQLGTELAVDASYLGRVKVGTHWADIIPHWSLALGTVQTFAAAGLTARVGWNMSGFPALLNPWTVVPLANLPNWEIALSAGAEGRLYARNAYVDGGLLGGTPRVNGNAAVGDYRLGLMGRVCSWSVSYTYVHRSREYELPPGRGTGEHRFGSVSVNRELAAKRCNVTRNWLLSSWTLDVGIGGAISRHLATGSPERVEDGMSMRVGVSKGLIGRLALGGELAGTLRQGEEPDALGVHRDVFLITKAITLAWRPTFGNGTLIVRAGGGRGLYKVEATRGLEHHAEREDRGPAWLAGVGYDFPIWRKLSLGLDVVWSHLGVASDAGPDASFLSSTFGFKWHP